MKSFPTFSIIIPTYNSSRSLGKALESIIIQGYQFKEVWVMDGLSSDNTVATAKEYAVRFPYIHVISEKDDGVYRAMNKGIATAKGDWLYFLGSDDYLHDREVLKNVAAELQTGDVDLLYGDVFLTGRNLRFGGPFDVLRLHTQENLCHQSIFYHRSVFQRIGNYNTNYKINADWDLNIRCFRHPQFTIKYIDRVIAFFNDYDGLSGNGYDLNFYKELPIPYIKKLQRRKFGGSLRDWLYKTGITPMIKQLFKAKN